MKRFILCAVAFCLISGVQTAKADRAVRIPVTDDNKDHGYEVETPLPGETLTVYLDLPADDEEEADKVITTTPTEEINEPDADDTVVNDGDDLDLRFGISAGIMFPGHPSVVFSGGLDFEIGKVDSMWRMQAALGAGNCAGSSHNGDGVAVNSGIALMASMGEHLRLGPGVDLLYCSDIASHPREKANERLVGTSFRAEYKWLGGYVSLTAAVGVGADTVPVPGNRETSAAIYGGLKLTLWTSE